jgi:hypothetical protein
MTGAAAGSAGGAQAGGGDAGDGEAQGHVDGQGQPDLAAIASQLEGNKSGQAELRQQIQDMQAMLQAQPWAQGQAAEGDDAGDEDAASGELGDDDGEIDLSFLDSGDLTDDPQATAEAFADIFDRAVSEQVKPLHDELANQRNELADQRQERAFEHLAAEIPALQDPDVQQAVGEAAQQLAQAMGRPELAGDAHFWKLTAMAVKAAELAAEEEGADAPNAAHLEGGGGAAPAGAQVDPLGPMFDEAGQGGKNALPFH